VNFCALLDVTHYPDVINIICVLDLYMDMITFYFSNELL